MKWFFVSSFSINVLNVAILLIFMIYFLLRIEKKSTATLLLNIFLIGVVCVFVSFFFIFSTVNPAHATAAWWILHTMVFAAIAMVQFAYHFPENIYPKESKIALIVCAVASCLVYPYYINKTLSMKPVYIFEANSYIFFQTPEIGMVIGAEILWMLVVFFRKAAQFSGYRIIGSMHHENESPGGLSLVRDILQLPARVVVAAGKIANAKDRRARSIRHLMLIFFSPVVLISAIIMAYEGLLSWQVVAHILGTGFMIIVFIFIVVYINSSSEPSTFMVKLVGISLGALLTVIGFGSSIAMVVRDDAYENQHLIEVGQCKRAVLQNDLSTLPEDVEYILLHPNGGRQLQKNFEKIYARDPDFVAPRKTDEGARLPGFSFSQVVSAQTAEVQRRYRKILPLDPTSFFVCYQFYAGGRAYEVGFDYMEYRGNLHETGMKLIYIVVGATLFVMLVFPYFFRESLVKPMNALLNGMQKVNQGDLKVVVTVNVEDEIGYLSNSFNRMVQSILEAREELKNSLDHQVKLTESYSCFVPKEFLQFLQKESVIDIKLGDHVQKEMTILFSDIRSFSRLSEQMTPQENFNFLNNCLGRIGPVVRNHNGFIDKYIGDAVMALFPHTPEDAVRAAIGMQRVIKTYNEHRRKSGYEPIQIGIGINKGIMMLGTIGEIKRMEGTVISDAVNVASRLEGLTKMYGAAVIVSKTALEDIADPSAFHYRFLDRVQVKGKKKWVEIYEIFDSDEPDLVALKIQTKPEFETGIRFYQEKKFDVALQCFQTVLEINPLDQAAGRYAGWCERIRQHGLLERWDDSIELEQR